MVQKITKLNRTGFRPNQTEPLVIGSVWTGNFRSDDFRKPYWTVYRWFWFGLDRTTNLQFSPVRSTVHGSKLTPLLFIKKLFYFFLFVVWCPFHMGHTHILYVAIIIIYIFLFFLLRNVMLCYMKKLNSYSMKNYAIFSLLYIYPTHNILCIIH